MAVSDQVAAHGKPTIGDKIGRGSQPTRTDGQTPPTSGVVGALRRAARVGGNSTGLFVVFILLCAFFTINSPYFLTYENALAVGDQIATLGVIAAGATLVIISGGIDLSVGSVVALAATVMGVSFQNHDVPLPIAIGIGLFAGVIVGLINGLLVTRFRIAAFIATLATMSAARGIANMMTNGVQISNYPLWFDELATARYFGISACTAALIVVFIAAGVYLSRRPGGRQIYAVGGNETVARLAGINVNRVKLKVYVVTGFLAGLGGIILASRLDSATPSMGMGIELQVIAAVVIGGASLSGGVGTMGGTVLGVLIIGILSNGLNIMGVSQFAQQVIIGIVIVGAVMIDSFRRRGN
jgi:ribose transport system permease protein